MAVAVLGFFIGWAVNWFDRLHGQNPATITMSGCVLCAGKNSGVPPFHDNDWTFNLGGSMFGAAEPDHRGSRRPGDPHPGCAGQRTGGDDH